MKKILFICILLFTLFTPTQADIRNVIFMIGDGMGLNQIYAAKSVEPGCTAIVSMPYTAIQTTYSANHYITDSAAAGTALATGNKTKNGMIGMNPDSIVTPSIMKLAAEKGLSTGVVVTCDVTHATPSAYYAHQPSRKMMNEIAIDLLESPLQIAFGGGAKYFKNRTDNRNLIQEFSDKGFSIARTQEEMLQSQNPKTLALLAEESLPYYTEGRGDYLPQATKKAIELLSKNKKGFFLMVEGSLIDYACHANDGKKAIGEVCDFDRAVATALAFARRDGHTLVIVTADHETGALTLGKKENNNVGMNFGWKDHTGAPVGIFAYGPGAENYHGWMDNTIHFSILKKFLNIK